MWILIICAAQAPFEDAHCINVQSVQYVLHLHEEHDVKINSTLRDRRRQQTARDIQLAALRLSLREGYAAVTTEAIAAETGISLRTFFNYYPNKQSAILGEPPVLNESETSWIINSKNPLVEDLAHLLGGLLDSKQMDRQVVRMLDQIWNSTPELMVVFRNSMDSIATAIGSLLKARFGPDREAEAVLIAELATHALSHTVRAWAADESMNTVDIPPMIERQLREVCSMLVQSTCPSKASTIR